MLSIYSTAVTLTYILLSFHLDYCHGIINGTVASLKEFPYIVSLRNETGRHFCGGSLVTRKHVLTAGHCIFTDLSTFFSEVDERYEAKDVKVVIDTICPDLYKGETYDVEELYPHPLYNVTNNQSVLYDIGIVKLKGEVTNPRIIPIRLSTSKPRVNQTGIIAGWGIDIPVDMIHTRPSKILKKLEMTPVSFEACRDKYYDLEDEFVWLVNNLYTSLAFCAKSPKPHAGSCTRDSGGPFVQDGELVGIIIFGIPCGTEYPDVFTSIYHYLDFIPTEYSPLSSKKVD